MCDLRDASALSTDRAAIIIIVADIVLLGGRGTCAFGADAGAGACVREPCAEAVAVQFETRDQLVIGVRRIGAELCALGVWL